MDSVFSIQEARDWFIDQRGDAGVVCVADGVNKVCKSFPEAERFFKEHEKPTEGQ